MNLNTKLVIVMISLLVLSMLALFVLNQYAQNDLVREIRESSREISKAVQVSIEDITSEDEVSRLSDYLVEARKKGLNEINIINIEGEIIDSSDPEKIGKKRELKNLEKGIHAAPEMGGGFRNFSQKPYEVVVPVIVGDEYWGYVQIKMALDNIRNLQRSNFLQRLIVSSMIFVVGIILTVFFARRYTKPIHSLVDDFKRVSTGDLSVTVPVKSNDEIGELAAGFNNMVEKLKEREVLEKRLNEAEHLSRVGRLASGIAHEIRNPLNYISLAVDHLKTEIRPDFCEDKEKLEELLENIKEEVRRANNMVTNFMNFGRPLQLRCSQVNYTDFLEKILSIVRERFPAQQIILNQQISGALPQLWVDPELFRTCILNFINNAIQAMPDGGVINLGASSEDNMVRLTFEDQGRGIAAEDIDKIFKPYFTTKDAGIGLGLAITERIISEHGGKIYVESELGKGTTFIVTLPLRHEHRSASVDESDIQQ